MGDAERERLIAALDELARSGEPRTYIGKDVIIAVAFGKWKIVPTEGLTPLQMAMWRDHPGLMVPVEWDPEYPGNRRSHHPIST
jgi:hypothetical protein